MRRYAHAGFALHPSVTARGHVARDRVPAVDSVREGTARDLALVAEVDRFVRGAAHGSELDLLLAEGARLLVADDGYVLVRDGRPILLAARDETAATDLLFAALAHAPADSAVEVGRLTTDQQWAIRACNLVGLELDPAGPFMTRGLLRPPTPYVPSQAFG
jgi:hypothetical protein